MITVPSAFTLDTGKDHWEVLLRARAIENQAFVVAPNQIGEAPPHYRSYGRSAIVDPWGVVLAQAPDERVLHRRRPRPRAPGPGPRARCRRWPTAARPPTGGRRRCALRSWTPMATLMDAKAPPVDKRRQILDAAIRVFARQGFHACRVSDIADEAGVAYGLVYHYFNSKDEVLNELFTERWSLLLAAIEEVDGQAISAREKLDAVARFIIDSYRHDPDLMKVIIVEVTRAANSFGRTHLPEIRRAYDMIAKIVADGQASGHVPQGRRPGVRLDVVLRRDRAAALGLGVRADPRRPRRTSTAPGAWSSRRSAAGSRRTARRPGRRVRRPQMWESLATLAAPGPRPARRREAAQRRGRVDRAARCGCSGSGSGTRCRACSRGSTPSRRRFRSRSRASARWTP